MSKKMWIIIGIIVAFIVMVIGIFASTNNRAISLEEQILSADSDIQVQEKRRTDLIYNLVDCVKEYDKHEAETLLAVVEARKTDGSVDIDEVTTQVSVVAEAYPELKSSENYREFMNELAITENKIAEFRKFYNNQIRSYNKYVRKFPRKQILRIMGYEVIEYKYLEYGQDDRQSVTNLFGD